MVFGKRLTERYGAILAEGSLDVKLPTIWTDEKKAEVGRVREYKTRRKKIRGRCVHR